MLNKIIFNKIMNYAVPFALYIFFYLATIHSSIVNIPMFIYFCFTRLYMRLKENKIKEEFEMYLIDYLLAKKAVFLFFVSIMEH